MVNFHNGDNKKTKHVKFSKKRTFLSPDKYTYVCLSGGKKCSLFRKFDVLSFLVISLLRFALLSYERRYMNSASILTPNLISGQYPLQSQSFILFCSISFIMVHTV